MKVTKMTLISLFDHISTVKHSYCKYVNFLFSELNVMFTALKHIRELRE